MGMRKYMPVVGSLPCRPMRSLNKEKKKLRVYTFVEDVVWYLCVIQRRSLEEVGREYSYQYRVRLVTDISFDAVYFQLAFVTGQSLLALTGCIVNQYEIIEIDDGHKPAFFCLQTDRLFPVHFDKSSMAVESI